MSIASFVRDENIVFVNWNNGGEGDVVVGFLSSVAYQYLFFDKQRTGGHRWLRLGRMGAKRDEAESG